MKDFNYYAPTEVVFGEQAEEQVTALVKKYGGTKVLVHYGGQSAVRSGLLDKICGLLKEGGVAYVTLGGVVLSTRRSVSHTVCASRVMCGISIWVRQNPRRCSPSLRC